MALPRPLFPKAQRIALDIETSGLKWREGIVKVIVVSDGEETHVIETQNYSNQDIREWLKHEVYSRCVVVHNSAFDLVWLAHHYNCGVPKKIMDTMVLETCLTAGLFQHDFRDGWRVDDEEDIDDLLIGVGLDSTVYRRLGTKIDKELQTSFIEDGPLSAEQKEYAALDGAILIPLLDSQQKEIKKEGVEETWDIERKVTPIFTEMSYKGIRLDLKEFTQQVQESTSEWKQLESDLINLLTRHVHPLRVQKYDEQLSKRVDRIRRQEHEKERLKGIWKYYEVLDRHHPEENSDEWKDKKWGDLNPHKETKEPMGMRRYVAHHMKAWNKANPPVSPPVLNESPINLGSPQQILAAFQDLGIPLENTRNKTIRSILPEVNPWVRDKILNPFLEWRKREKFLNSFGEPLWEALQGGDRVFSNYRQYGTLTGRPASYDKNMLQIPSKSKFRKCFIPDEGEVFIIADFSQMELREIAEFAEDKVMLKAFKEDLDLHTYTAQLMFGIESVTPEQRKTAKIINFGILYGMGPKLLQLELASEGVYVSLDQTKEYLRMWHRTYREASRQITKWQRQSTDKGYTATVLGRKRRFKLAPDAPFWLIGKAQRAGGNHPVQGGCSDVTKIAMYVIDTLLKPIGGRIVLNVYDEIVAQVPVDKALVGQRIVHTAMEEAAKRILKVCPVKVDSVVANSWSEEDVFSG